MARIAGVNIPNHQHVNIALTAIYGIGLFVKAVVFNKFNNLTKQILGYIDKLNTNCTK